MSLQDLPSQHAGRPRGHLWSTVREEVWEILWLVGIIAALSLTSVGVAVVLAGV